MAKEQIIVSNFNGQQPTVYAERILTLQEGYYTIVNNWQSSNLTLYAPSDGGAIILKNNTKNTDNALWYLKYDNKGFIHFQNKATGKGIQIPAREKMAVNQVEYNLFDSSQAWDYVAVNNSYYHSYFGTHAGSASSLWLAANGKTMYDGIGVVVDSDNNNGHESFPNEWTITLIDSSTPSPNPDPQPEPKPENSEAPCIKHYTTLIDKIDCYDAFGTMSHIKKVYAGTSLVYELVSYKPRFADNTWEQIAQACQNNDPIINNWNIGDTKSMLFKGQQITIAIAGKNHDKYSDSGKIAPLTFTTTEPLPQSAVQYSVDMHSSETWDTSNARQKISQMVSNFEFGSFIKPVTKITGNGTSTGLITTQDKLFLFAESELFNSGVAGWSYQGYSSMAECAQCKQYEFYKNSANTKPNCWCRSPYQNNKSFICGVENNRPKNWARHGWVDIIVGFCF